MGLPARVARAVVHVSSADVDGLGEGERLEGVREGGAVPAGGGELPVEAVGLVHGGVAGVGEVEAGEGPEAVLRGWGGGGKVGAGGGGVGGGVGGGEDAAGGEGEEEEEVEEEGGDEGWWCHGGVLLG